MFEWGIAEAEVRRFLGLLNFRQPLAVYAVPSSTISQIHIMSNPSYSSIVVQAMVVLSDPPSPIRDVVGHWVWSWI